MRSNTTLAHRVQLLSTLDVSGATTIRSTLDISGNLSMNKNSIKDVDTIYFSKNTYITSNNVDDKLRLYGNSIFMEASVNGNFVFTGNSTNVDLNFLTLSPSGYTINYNHIDDKIKFNTNDFVIDKGNNYIGIQTDTPSATLEVNGNAIISGNLSMSNQFINDVSGIYFTQGNLFILHKVISYFLIFLVLIKMSSFLLVKDNLFLSREKHYLMMKTLILILEVFL
jgi:hypothetical protein